MPPISLGAVGGLCSAAFALSWKATSAQDAPRPLYVRTKRGVPNSSPNVCSEKENPCEHCMGLGRTSCWSCNGRGRVNHTDDAMLPKGVFPVWCRNCRGGGLVYCNWCMGTGVRREPIGFRL
uniref:Hsp40 cysteine-rich domain superfamily n=1 Tax=Tetraselmis sp. GSL018 TaxID=582737 RepID=A0A061SD15_9CHLO